MPQHIACRTAAAQQGDDGDRGPRTEGTRPGLLEIGRVRIWYPAAEATELQRAHLPGREYYWLLLAPGEMYLTDAHQLNHQYRVEGLPGGSQTLVLEIPQRIAPLTPEHATRLLKRPLRAREGAGALLAQFLTGLVQRAHHLRPWVASRLETVVVDLFAATVVGHLDADHADRPDDGHLDADQLVHAAATPRDLTRRIHTYVQQRLSDPDLTPRSVAAAHHISLSYLHRLFQHEDLPVAARIRHERLEAARRDLADVGERATPVHVIAARWGFAYHSSFIRAFQAAYGTSPRAYRRHAREVHANAA